MPVSEPLTILCFGDSLTWGARADRTGRHAVADRWPTTLGAALAAALGRDVEVIAEGLNGRMTGYDAPAAADLNGARLLPSVLSSHAPLDLVIVMLGTNDILLAEATPRQAARGMKRLAEITRTHPMPMGATAPRVLLAAPPHLTPDPLGLVTQDDIARSRSLFEAYKEATVELGVPVFDAAEVAATDPVDGIHLDPANTRAIGTALAPIVKELLSL